MKRSYWSSWFLAVGLAGTMAACGSDDESDGAGGAGGAGGGGGADGGTSGPATCDGDVCTLTGEIIADFTLTADKQWLLRGGVFVGDDTNETVLTIEPGTTVYGETSSTSFLAIRRGSKLMAEGTAEAPIVFTSGKAPGSRARGDWGGLIINGRARLNSCADGSEDCEAEGEGGTGFYGGPDDRDNSGVLRYLRVEFGGKQLSPDNELNGIAFQGVGSGTTVEYVQVHMSKDDGVEFFGGAVNFKYVLTTGIGDDNLDWTEGWRGMGQFFVAQQYADDGDNGIEADNNGKNNDALPRSEPTLANLTLVGVPDGDNSDIGVLLREGTAAHISNAIVVGFGESALDIDNDATFAVAATGDTLTGLLTIEGSILSGDSLYGDDPADPWMVETFFADWNEGNRTVDPMLAKPFAAVGRDFAPMAGSPAMQDAASVEAAFFTPVDFVGGVDPANDWTVGWTTDVQN